MDSNTKMAWLVGITIIAGILVYSIAKEKGLTIFICFICSLAILGASAYIFTDTNKK